MPQFFVEGTLEGEVKLTGSDARHIARALRLAAGDWIVLSDGRGRSFRARILSSSPREVLARIEEEIVRRQTKPAPALALAIIKGERFEWALQKTVEIGCQHLIPFRSARTVPRLAEEARDAKRSRWQAIALAAAKQSGLPFRPRVDPLVDFPELCARFGTFGRTILLDEGERQQGLRAASQHPPVRPAPDLLIIGPEGGFADEERERAATAGAIAVTLGQQILRVETAAIVALSIWQYELGNLDVNHRDS